MTTASPPNRPTRWASSAALAVCFTSVVAIAPSIAADGAVELVYPLTITCETSAVKLDANPFKASKGGISLELTLDDPADAKGPGRWKIIDSGAEHVVSFSKTTKESCAPDCPFTRGKDGTLQLWSPKPLALTQLDDNTALILVTINESSLELKASSFRKKELAGLERGDCKLADSAVKSQEPASNASPPVETNPAPDAPTTETPEKAAELPAPPPTTDPKQ